MHFVTSVCHERNYTLRVGFEDGSVKLVDLHQHLDGEMFQPLKDIGQFRTCHLDPDLDTVVWDNGADMSPDFLYKIGTPLVQPSTRKVAEPQVPYGNP